MVIHAVEIPDRTAEPTEAELLRGIRRDIEYQGHLIVRLGDAHTDTNIRLHLARPWAVLEHLEQTCPTAPSLYVDGNGARREVEACVTMAANLRELARDAELRRGANDAG